jgi:uncharacterized membrane protein
MSARLSLIWDHLRSSYWFVPAIMASISIALATAMIELSSIVDDRWLLGARWLFDPESARNLLASVSTSMLGVAGVTFSITIVSVVYASGQYGPRVISNFMADSGNQVTLGTFIATFLYCLVVTSSVRGSYSAASGTTAAGTGPFVPHLAVIVALLLTLCSIAVLIYFIHHVPQSIHVSNLVNGIGQELEGQIQSVFPERIGRSARDVCEGEGDQRVDLDRESVICVADHCGYVQSVDGEELIAIATRHGLLFRLETRPGDFVSLGDALLRIWPAGELAKELEAGIRASFALGPKRTALQDLRFPADELVEIAVRALSPGVNDPFTAIACIDWLSNALKSFVERDTPSAERAGPDGVVRLIASPTTFADLVSETIGTLAHHARSEPTVTRHLERQLREIARRTEDPGRTRILDTALEWVAFADSSDRLDAPRPARLVDGLRA